MNEGLARYDSAHRRRHAIARRTIPGPGSAILAGVQLPTSQEDIKPMESPVIAEKSPVVLELEPGTYWWCACGRSANQPWCDGSHKGAGFSPREVVIEAKKNYAMCRCKHSANGAFCDGTHRNL